MDTNTEKIKPWIPKIEIKTHPNGYSMSVEGQTNPNGFMYFTKEKLLEGFMLHVGLGLTETLNKSDMAKFLETANKWNDNKECVKEISRQEAEIKKLSNLVRLRERDALRLREKILNLVDEIKATIKDNNSDKQIVKLTKLAKSYGSIKKLSTKDLELLNSTEFDDDDDDDE